jgi:hypothetical protein
VQLLGLLVEFFKENVMPIDYDNILKLLGASDNMINSASFGADGSIKLGAKVPDAGTPGPNNKAVPTGRTATGSDYMSAYTNAALAKGKGDVVTGKDIATGLAKETGGNQALDRAGMARAFALLGKAISGSNPESWQYGLSDTVDQIAAAKQNEAVRQGIELTPKQSIGITPDQQKAMIQEQLAKSQLDLEGRKVSAMEAGVETPEQRAKREWIGTMLSTQGQERSPKNPFVHEFEEGSEVVARQYVPDTGEWKELARGPRWNAAGGDNSADVSQRAWYKIATSEAANDPSVSQYIESSLMNSDGSLAIQWKDPVKGKEALYNVSRAKLTQMAADPTIGISPTLADLFDMSKFEETIGSFSKSQIDPNTGKKIIEGF